MKEASSHSKVDNYYHISFLPNTYAHVLRLLLCMENKTSNNGFITIWGYEYVKRITYYYMFIVFFFQVVPAMPNTNNKSMQQNLKI